MNAYPGIELRVSLAGGLILWANSDQLHSVAKVSGEGREGWHDLLHPPGFASGCAADVVIEYRAVMLSPPAED